MIYNKSNLPKILNKFIAIDGINGSGKSTLIKNLQKYFTLNKHPLEIGKEPGGTETGNELRKIVLSSNNITPETQFFIMSASRAEFIDKIVKPAINNNTFFITDRFYYSSLAFQSYAGGLNFDFVYNVSKYIIKDCIPDITFILDLDLETAFKRINIRNQNTSETDSFENENLAYHKKVRNGFIDMTERLPENFYIVDATRSENEITDTVLSILKEIYNI